MTPPILPIPKAVRDIRANDASSFWAKDLAIKFVAPMDRNNNGRGALSLMLLAGPRAASSTTELVRPMKEASMSDINGEQTYIPSAGIRNERHSRNVGVSGYSFFLFIVVPLVLVVLETIKLLFCSTSIIFSSVSDDVVLLLVLKNCIPSLSCRLYIISGLLVVTLLPLLCRIG